MMDSKNIKNKLVKTEDVETKEVNLTDYNFPDYQLTINASTREEAEQKLAEILEAKNK